MGARPVPAPLQPDHNRVFVVQHKGVLFADYVPPLLCMWSTHILRPLTTNLRRGEWPCGGCRGMRHPGESLLDAASSRTLGSQTAMWSSCASTKSCHCSTAYARHRTFGRNVNYAHSPRTCVGVSALAGDVGDATPRRKSNRCGELLTLGRN